MKGKWEYCKDCASQWLGSERVRKSHVPYRDKASQNFMKPVYRKPRGPTGGTHSARAESSQRSAPEPEAEDLLVEDTAPPPQEPDDMGLEDDIPADIPELVRQYPTLDEYQARWDRLKDHHARPVPEAFPVAILSHRACQCFGRIVLTSPLTNWSRRKVRRDSLCADLTAVSKRLPVRVASQGILTLLAASTIEGVLPCS